MVLNGKLTLLTSPHESPERHAELQAACVNHPRQPEIIARHIRANDYAPEVVRQITQRKHQQIVVSNTQPLALRVFLEAVKLHEDFPPETAFAADHHQNGSHLTKVALVKTYLRTRSFDRIEVVGDTTGDGELAERVQARFWLYSHPGRPFPDVRMYRRIRDLRDILSEL